MGKIISDIYRGDTRIIRLAIRRDGATIPPLISAHIKRDVHTFKNDTPSLLEHVYATKPLLFAAPGDFLDFSIVAKQNFETLDKPIPAIDKLSASKRQLLKKRSKAAQKRINENFISRRKSFVSGRYKPKYDDVYYEGVDWLDSLAGSEMPIDEELTVVFSDDVWNSEARRGAL